MKIAASLVMSTLALSLSTVCFAGAHCHKQTRGFYVSGNAGYGVVDINNRGIANPGRDGFAWNANAGYQINRYLGVEIGYLNFRDVNYTSGAVSGMARDNYAFDAALKGTIMSPTGVNVFWKLGLARTHTKYETAAPTGEDLGSHWSTAGLYAVGLGYRFNHHWGTELTGLGLTAQHGVPAKYQATVGLTYHI